MAHTFAGRKPANFIATVYCAASHTPIVSCAGKKVQKSDCFHDVLGYHWCPEHAERGRLLNWAKANGYPHIAFALPDGSRRELGYPDVKQAISEKWWRLAVVTGDDEAISAAARSIGLTTASQDDETLL